MILLLFFGILPAALADDFGCYLQASIQSENRVYPPSAAVTLCEGMMSNTTPHDCYSLANKMPDIGPSVAFRICTRSTSVTGPINCFKTLVDKIGASVAAILCRGSKDSEAADRLNCLNQASEVGAAGTSPGYTVDLGLAAKLCAK